MMVSKFRWLITAIVCGCCLAALSTQTLAQAYPTHSVRLVIPYAPGGPSDLLGRAVASKLGDMLHEQFVIENRPGVGAIVGAQSVAKATPDGYTLFLGDISTFGVNPNMYKSLPYNARKDFTPIGPFASGAVFLFVGASVPVRNIQELIALAKKKPGEVSYGSSGAGNMPTHIGPELFRDKNGLNVLHVPYKGASPAMVDVVAGRVSFIMTTGLSAAKPFLDSGKVRPLAVTGTKRASVLPDVPTFAEAGSPMPEMNAGVWWGLLGPAGLPRNIVVKLNETIAQALAAPDVLARLSALNLDPMIMTPEAFTDFINSEIETWGRVVKRAKITAD